MNIDVLQPFGGGQRAEPMFKQSSELRRSAGMNDSVRMCVYARACMCIHERRTYACKIYGSLY